MTDINLSSFIWSVLRGDYKQSEYGRGAAAIDAAIRLLESGTEVTGAAVAK